MTRTFVPLLFAVLIQACVASQRVAPVQYVTEHQPSQILVMDDQGFMHLIDRPAIRDDHIVGIEAGTADTLSIPVSDVSDAMVKAKSPRRTAILVGSLAGLTTLGVVAILTMGSGDPCQQNPSGKGSESTGGVGQCDVTLPS